MYEIFYDTDVISKTSYMAKWCTDYGGSLWKIIFFFICIYYFYNMQNFVNEIIANKGEILRVKKKKAKKME